MTRFTRTVAFVLMLAPVWIGAGKSGAAQTPAAATEKYPPQFPSPGAVKIFENDLITVWDDMESYYDNHIHKHLYDFIGILIQGAPDISRGSDGKMSIDTRGGDEHPYEAVGRTGYAQCCLGPHSEWIQDLTLPQRHIFIEMKKTIGPDAVNWSTDPTGKSAAAVPVYATVRPNFQPTIMITQKKWPSLGTVMEKAGMRKRLDNENVVIWDEILTATEHVLRKNVRDVLAVQLWDGDTTWVNGDGTQPVKMPRGSQQTPRRKMPSVFYLPAGTGPYSSAADDRYHPSRTIWIELKGTEAKDCRGWSADDAGHS